MKKHGLKDIRNGKKMGHFSNLNKENKAYTTDEVGDYIVNFIKNN